MKLPKLPNGWRWDLSVEVQPNPRFVDFTVTAYNSVLKDKIEMSLRGVDTEEYGKDDLTEAIEMYYITIASDVKNRPNLWVNDFYDEQRDIIDGYVNITVDELLGNFGQH